MKRSSKILITTIAVIGLSAAGLSWVSAGGWGRGCQGYGVQGDYPGFGGRQGMGMRGGAPGAMMGQRMESLKQQLQITEEQEPAWEAFQQAMVEKMGLMSVRLQQRGTQMAVNERTSRMRQHAEQMNEMAAAIDRFYGVLTPEQQKLADTMMPMGRRFR